MSYSDWEQVMVNPLDIKLDPSNPRLDLGEAPSEEEIIEYLLEHFKMKELADSILERGYNKLEPVALVKENDQLYVIEGNRRITTCKLLLNKELVPVGESFPELPKQESTLLESIPAVIATSRTDAAPYITNDMFQGVL